MEKNTHVPKTKKSIVILSMRLYLKNIHIQGRAKANLLLTSLLILPYLGY